MRVQEQSEIIVIVYSHHPVQDSFYQKKTPIHISVINGKLEQVNEERIETLFPDYLEKKVVQAMIKAHPYEEVAYDIYRLDNKGESLGLRKNRRNTRNDLGGICEHRQKCIGCSNGSGCRRFTVEGEKGSCPRW